MKEFLKKLAQKCIQILKKLVSFLLNPHLLICFGIAWMITNGWCYIFMLLGSVFNIKWMFIAGTAYAGILWLPFTPEKVVTLIISIFLLRFMFPNDTRTLGILKTEYGKAKESVKELAVKIKDRKNRKGKDMSVETEKETDSEKNR